MFNFLKKLKFYAVKTENNTLACCSKSGEPLIAKNKDQLEILLFRMKEQDDRYEKCKVVKVSE